MATPAVSEVDALCEQARRLMKEKKVSEARTIYEDAVAKDPRSIPARRVRAGSGKRRRDAGKKVDRSWYGEVGWRWRLDLAFESCV